MLKTVRQFYVLAAGLMLLFGLILALVLILGDTAGQPVKANLVYYPEGANGLPQVVLTFEGTKLPERNAVEAAFEINPALNGDFSWNGTSLIFTPSSRLLNNTEYRVRLQGGLKLINGGRMDYGPVEWSFRTRPVRLAYLKREGQAINLWLEDGTGAGARPLTFETERKVLEFSVSPGGERIIYSLQEANNLEVSLWLVRTSTPAINNPENKPVQLVYEANVSATAPRWSPGGDLIAYERRLLFKGGGFSAAQLWLVRADGTSLPPLYGGYQQVGVGMAWAAGGNQAFFWEPRREALGVFNFVGEPVWKPLPGLKLQSLAPSPDGRELILVRYDYSGTLERQLLWRLTAGKSKGEWQVSPLQPPALTGYNDRLPAWSPDGRWVSFLRQEVGPGTNRTTRLWLFDTQEGKARPLIIEENEAAPNLNQGNYQWSPDGQKIIFERYPASTRPEKEGSELWEATLDGKNLRRIVTGVFAPKWIN